MRDWSFGNGDYLTVVKSVNFDLVVLKFNLYITNNPLFTFSVVLYIKVRVSNFFLFLFFLLF